MNNYNTLSPSDSEALINTCYHCGKRFDEILNNDCGKCPRDTEQELIDICESNREQIERGKHDA